MAVLYAAARVSAFGNGPSNELAAQRRALADMQSCATRSASNITTCLQGRYDQRNEALAIATAIREPALAMPVLRQVDPTYAPVVEAIALWATEPQAADWAAPTLATKRAHILTLLAPVMDAILIGRDNRYAREILTIPRNDGIAVRGIADVLRSPRHFAFFLDVIGPSLDKDGSAHPHIVPCAAIVDHPALLAATQPVFGSTMDNFALITDCNETLPRCLR